MSPSSVSLEMSLSAGTKIFLALTLLLVVYGTYTESLMCFQCEATSENEDCFSNWQVMANATTRHLYAKNCSSNVNWTRCMIQYSEKGGKILFFHRACHDGSYFEKHLQSPRFYNKPADNQSTCDLSDESADTAICYRPCDTDLCNGPLLLPTPNCTNEYGEECGAPGIFLMSQLVTLEVLAVVTSLLVAPWVVFGHH